MGVKKKCSFLKFLGPGILITVGFIDPGNWASNVAAGSDYGYKLLWMVTLSTIMLIFLQHNAARLGITTGLSLSQCSNKYLRPWIGKIVLGSSVLSSVATALAEILGGAIALNMLFGLHINVGAVLMLLTVVILLKFNSYSKLEKVIIGFVSLIGFSFILELFMVKVDWARAVCGSFSFAIPDGSLPVVMSVLGAVVMPHNLFLHSEIIQSRDWKLPDNSIDKKKLKFEFVDTFCSMVIGWAINSAMIILAAATFFENGISVSLLEQAQTLLQPIVGNAAALIFAIALLLAGISSSVTAAMAGGSIYAGFFDEKYDMKSKKSGVGIGITLISAVIAIFFIGDTFAALVYSQIFLSMQLPITIFAQLSLTGSGKVMGEHKNNLFSNIILYTTALAVTVLNILLIVSFFV